MPPVDKLCMPFPLTSYSTRALASNATVGENRAVTAIGDSATAFGRPE